MNVDRTGTFLATEIDRALRTTAIQGLPQLVIKMQLVHWFDPSIGENGDWADFSEYEMETTGYFTLVFNGKKGPETSLSYDRLMKVYGWDGKDFQVLTEMSPPDMFMIGVQDNDPEFADKNPYVVNWIDDKGADPHGGLKKLDDAGIKALQSQFGALLGKTGKTAPPASAKKTAKAPPEAPPKAPQPKKQTAAEKKAAKKRKSEKVAADNARLEAEKGVETKAKVPAKTLPKTPPVAPAVPAVPATPAEVADTVVDETKTKQEAYEYVFEMQANGTTDDQRNNAWNAAIAQVAGDVDQKEITDEQWYKIMHETLNDVGAV